MSTLSQLSPPPARLALLRRVPFWAQALALCALFAIAGVAVVDDYGVIWDEAIFREMAIGNFDYVATGDTDGLYIRDYRYYGMAFEMPLLLAERALGLQDTRHMYLMRHLLSHLFFIAGGFACGMLAYRMMGNRWVALFAILIFLLHPRLYAHSFFNSRDVPFAVMMIIALYLTHRAFRKDTLGAFLLCGVGAGLAMNMRPFALMLPPMILAMRGLDLWQAGKGERKRILASVGIFAGAALAVVYIIHPYYWENPLRFIEGLRVFSQHPTLTDNLFMGEIYRSDAVPWNYVPVWFAITAPPIALLLGAVGCAAACRRAIARPLAALRDRETRFRMLLLGCFALPVVAVIALQSNIYNDWRQMYFLWTPFCLLAAVGLDTIANINMRKGICKVGARLPGWVRGGRRLHIARRALAYGVAGAGLTTTLTAMVALHPNQQVYFNGLTDTDTPGALAKRYDLDYWNVAQRESLEYLLARYPDGALRVWPGKESALVMPQKDRGRLLFLKNPHAADFFVLKNETGHRLLRNSARQTAFYIHPRVELQSVLEQPAIHTIRAYGSDIALVFAKDADVYRAAYDDVAANGTLLARSEFDIYAYDGALYYLGANCSPPVSIDATSVDRRFHFPALLGPTAAYRVFLHIVPADLVDLPADRREHGFENRDFRLDAHAAFFNGMCIHRQPLPDYPIARVRTGQNAATLGGAEWRVDVNLAARAAAQAIYDGIAAGDYGHPVAQSDFDVYLRGNGLAYLKENCAAGDTDARFFLHIIPADLADLPADSRELGFANLDFQFAEHGAYAGDKCVVTRDLPGYAIERIRTGQFVSGEGRVWGVEFRAAQ